jgi:hypothetical protein
MSGPTRTTLTAPTVTSWASLASSLTAVASSSAVTSGGASTNVTGHQVQVTITGPATMTASATTAVNLLLYASADGTNWTNANTTNELIDGTDKAITLSANGNMGIPIGSIPFPLTTAGTSDVRKSQWIDLAPFFPSGMPAKYVIVAQNQCGAALAASGHAIEVVENSYS